LATTFSRSASGRNRALTRYPHVFRPFQIGSVTIKNRIFIPAHTTNFAEHFLPTDQHVAYHRERAEGGVGLIFVEPLRVHRTALGRAGGLSGTDPRAIEGLRRIVDAIHEGGAQAFVQITHTGRHSDNFVDRLPPWGPSSIPWTTSGEIPHAMTRAEMDEVREGYIQTAQLAIDAGFKGLEVHFGHGHLLHQFLSPAANKRTDAYGGRDENRLRYPLEILRAVIEHVDGRLAVGVRLSVDELMRGGLDVDASREIAARAAATTGVAFINASVSAYSWPSVGYHVADMSYPSHPYLNETVGLRDAIGSLPLLTANRYTSLADAEEGLATGAIDMIGMNRAHMAEPNIIRKTLANEEDHIRPCVSSNACIGQIALHRPIACTMNPRVGRESVWSEELPPTPSPRKLLVVGGGPAGLEFARTAAGRGHHVTLWESADEIGGVLAVAGTGIGRKDLHGMRAYLMAGIARSTATIVTGKLGNLDDIVRAAPDAVIIATGATAAAPTFPGGDVAIGAGEALEIGRDRWRGARVCIIDVSGSWSTLSVAETLSGSGADVTLIGGPETVLWDINVYSRMTALERLRANGVTIRPSTEALAIEGPDIHVHEKHLGVENVLRSFTHFVFASRGTSNFDLCAAVEKAGLPTHAIGDALAPHSLFEAMFDGYSLGRRI